MSLLIICLVHIGFVLYCIVYRNQAGAVYITNSSQAQFASCQFSSNCATKSTALLIEECESVAMINSIVNDSESSSSFGAVYFGSGVDLIEIAHCDFSDCRFEADNETPARLGAAVYIYAGDIIQMSNVYFANNAGGMFKTWLP